jgi:hypothetical protein
MVLRKCIHLAGHDLHELLEVDVPVAVLVYFADHELLISCGGENEIELWLNKWLINI